MHEEGGPRIVCSARAHSGPRALLLPAARLFRTQLRPLPLCGSLSELGFLTSHSLPSCHVPCSLANLGKKAADEGWGIPAFEERRDTHLFTRR